MTLPARCYICGRALNARTARKVDTRDDQVVYVGPDCYASVMRAGDAGYKHDNHYVRFFPLADATNDVP